MLSRHIKNFIFFLALLFSISAQAEGVSHHNLTSNTIANVMGIFNLEYSYKLIDHLTLGIRGFTGKTSFGDKKMSVNSCGSISRYYFRPALKDSSWYLAISADRENFDASVTSHSIVYSGTSKGITFAAGGGYHWFWESFNLSLGLLLKSKQKIELYDGVGNTYKEPINSMMAVDFTIGGKF